MKKRMIGVWILSSLSCLLMAQGLDPPLDTSDDVDDPDPPLAMPLSVGILISGGMNYHALVPKEGGAFKIANLGGLPASFLLVSEGPNGQEVKQLELGAGLEKTVGPDLFEDDVVIVSLQPFRVFTEKAFELAGEILQEATVNAPIRPLRLTPVRMLDGSIRTIAVAHDNRAYYPVYIHRQPIGDWAPDAKKLITDHGVLLEGALEK